jgi:hypothetical protein
VAGLFIFHSPRASPLRVSRRITSPVEQQSRSALRLTKSVLNERERTMTKATNVTGRTTAAACSRPVLGLPRPIAWGRSYSPSVLPAIFRHGDRHRLPLLVCAPYRRLRCMGNLFCMGLFHSRNCGRRRSRRQRNAFDFPCVRCNQRLLGEFGTEMLKYQASA